MARANEATDRGGAPARERELRARGRRTMRKLLDAGTEVFARRGYHAARVDDIVKAARTSHGTFYLYFSNKEDLFRSLAEDVAEQMEGLAESLGELTPDATGRTELREWLEQFGETYQRCGPVIAAWTEAETEESEVGQIGTDLLGDFAATLGRRIAASSTDVDPGVAAMALVAMIERVHYYAIAGMLDTDRDVILDTLAAVTHGSLFGADVADTRRAVEAGSGH